MKDSKRSPHSEKTAIASAMAADENEAGICATAKVAIPVITPPAAPPMTPDHVFFGLIFGHNFGPPIVFPAKYAKTSVAHTTANSQTIAVRPRFGDCRAA